MGELSLQSGLQRMTWNALSTFIFIEGQRRHWCNTSSFSFSPRYLDGWHYCTKTSWPSESDGYPSLFDKAFHVEIGLGVLRRDKSLKTNEFHEAPLPQEMVIDYVRIFQVENEYIGKKLCHSFTRHRRYIVAVI